MTIPQVPLVDIGNMLLAPGPAELHTGYRDDASGRKIGILTIRTPSTTLTCQLDATGLRKWGSLLNSLADQLSGSGIVVANASDVAVVSQWPPSSRA